MSVRHSSNARDTRRSPKRQAAHSVMKRGLTKGALSENLEIRKAEIAGQVRAFDSMLSAAHFSYFVLREQVNEKLAGGDALFAEANKKAAEASASLWHLPKDDKEIWYQVYQRSKYLSDLIKHFDGTNRSEVIRKNASELGGFIAKLQDAGQKVFAEAKRLQLDREHEIAAEKNTYLYGLH